MSVINKIRDIYVNEGMFSLMKRSILSLKNKFRVRVLKKHLYNKEKQKLENTIDEILKEKYKRVVVWRGSFGWKTKLFQRHQQIAISLAKQDTLVFFEVTRHTEKVDFIEKISDNLYLVDYELKEFSRMFNEKLEGINKPKFLQIYSTAWDLKFDLINDYVSSGYRLLYEYIDDLNPVLAGLDSIPEEVMKIYNYVVHNEDVLVVTSADKLYSNIVLERGSKKNVILSSNGVDVEHFTLDKVKPIKVLEDIKNNYKTIIGYYGAIASWFDFDILKSLASKNPSIAFVLIGVKYDDSFDKSEVGQLSNVFYLDAVNYDELPYYASYFDIAWIPFILNDITMATNPVKAFEYMAMEKFIIASDMPECRKFKSINIAKNERDYQKLIDNYKKMYTDDYIKLLRKEAKENSWDNKAHEIIKLMETRGKDE